MLDALWISQRQPVRAVTHAKFKFRQVKSHKLPSMLKQLHAPIHCGFIAYLFLAHGKHFPNNIYISYALAYVSFSSVLLVNVVFGLGGTLVMNLRINWSHLCSGVSHTPFIYKGNLKISNICPICWVVPELEWLETMLTKCKLCLTKSYY